MPSQMHLPALCAVPDADRPAVAEIVDLIRSGHATQGQHDDWLVHGVYAAGFALQAVHVSRIVTTLEA